MDLGSESSPCGRFVRFDEVVGKGAFKVVYKGFDLEQDAEVAWCKINMNREIAAAKSNLLSEIYLMEAVVHENVIKCKSWWIDHGRKSINTITEFFSSGTLRQFRNKHGSITMKAVKDWGQQILKGLNYLHSREPRIVHRDLKCDNIFVHGSTGQIQIGDLGLATLIQHQHDRLSSVVGTPEFMAPEIYEEDYSELVDVYAFGMCMLEMITGEYPYSECNTVAHIFKKVTAGVKPDALCKVKDSQARDLIEKCLLPASQRPSAAELLKDPFFSVLPDSTVGSLTADCRRCLDHLQLRLRGKRVDAATILFDLHIGDDRSHVGNCFEFPFDLKTDDALKIALEMVDGKDLAYHQVPVAVELIDTVLVELEPSWMPCLLFDGSQQNSPSGCRGMRPNWQFSAVVH